MDFILIFFILLQLYEFINRDICLNKMFVASYSQDMCVVQLNTIEGDIYSKNDYSNKLIVKEYK